MEQRRTDLAAEAHELRREELRNAAGVKMSRRGRVTVVEVTDAEGAGILGKPEGTYVTLDLSGYRDALRDDAAERAATELGRELRAMLGQLPRRRALVAGLGNRAMTPDAIGPLAAEHVLVTRHLTEQSAFAGFASVCVLTPGVLGRTGLEAAETLRAAVEVTEPDVLIAVDALASRSLSRVCATVQLSDTGLVPGSGVGNRRHALNRETLGVPVIAVGVPTVVDARTLALDILEEAGAALPDPAALGGRGRSLMVTTQDIDEQVRELSRIVGYGIDLALQPLSFDDLCALIG